MRIAVSTFCPFCVTHTFHLTFCHGIPCHEQKTTSSECGQERLSRRIINGKEAARDRYPWMVSVGQGCGGSLITDRHVLTAAHCLASSRPSPGSLKITLGAHTESDRSSMASLPVESYVIHEDYDDDGEKMSDDIAIIKLKYPVVFRDTADAMNPVCLPDFSQHDNLFLIGWGYQNSNGQKVRASALFEVDLPEVDNSTCNKYWGSKMFQSDKEICAGDERGGCQGDSGGPLSTRKDGFVYQVGVVSYGPAHCNVARFDKPNVYERVTFHKEWILKNTAGGQWCSAPHHPFSKIMNNKPSGAGSESGVPVAEVIPILPSQPSGPSSSPLPGSGSGSHPGAIPVKPINGAAPILVPASGTPGASPVSVPGPGTPGIKPVRKGSCTCGMEEVRRRVRNGIESRHTYPWMASIIGDGFTCAGSLINSKFILTAAHCLMGKQVSQLRVTLGSHTEMSRLIDPAVEISRIIMHDGFNGHILNDIALMELKNELPDDRNKPVCLPRPGSVPVVSPFLAGWGTSIKDHENGMIGSKVLMQADLDPQSDAVCRADYGSLSTGKICAGTCHGATKGDGGAPLMERREGKVWQTGITCFGTPSDCTKPDLYEDVAQHYEWIMDKTREATYCD